MSWNATTCASWYARRAGASPEAMRQKMQLVVNASFLLARSRAPRPRGRSPPRGRRLLLRGLLLRGVRGGRLRRARGPGAPPVGVPHDAGADLADQLLDAEEALGIGLELALQLVHAREDLVVLEDHPLAGLPGQLVRLPADASLVEHVVGELDHVAEGGDVVERDVEGNRVGEHP